MPELAEVAYFQKLWKPALRSKISKVLIHEKSRIFRGTDIPLLRKELPKRTFKAFYQHGKQMLFEFKGTKDSLWLALHLGMTGEFSLEKLSYEPKKHDHLVLVTPKHQLVFTDYRMFGKVDVDISKDFPEWWQNLPLQILDKKFTYTHFKSFVSKRGKRPLKAFLLLQECFPGVGNWMADEILWQSKLLPSRLTQSLKENEQKELFKKLRWVCSSALKLASPHQWPDPPKSWLFHHRWGKNHFCPRDKTLLLRKEVGGRTTCWCPKCQK